MNTRQTIYPRPVTVTSNRASLGPHAPHECISQTHSPVSSTILTEHAGETQIQPGFHEPEPNFLMHRKVSFKSSILLSLPFAGLCSSKDSSVLHPTPSLLFEDSSLPSTSFGFCFFSHTSTELSRNKDSHCLQTLAWSSDPPHQFQPLLIALTLYEEGQKQREPGDTCP